MEEEIQSRAESNCPQNAPASAQLFFLVLTTPVAPRGSMLLLLHLLLSEDEW
jgi:hypothetical protein